MSKKRIDKFTFSNIAPDEIFLDSANIPGFDKQQCEGRVEKPIKTSVFLTLGFVFFILGTTLFLRTGYLQLVKGEVFAEYASKNHLKIVDIYPERGLIYDRRGELLAWNDSVFSLVLPKSMFESVDLHSELELFSEAVGFSVSEFRARAGSEKEDVVVAIFDDWEEINKIYKQWGNLPLQIKPLFLRDYSQLEGVAHVVGYVGYPFLSDIKKNPSLSLDNLLGKDGVEKFYENVLRGSIGSKLIERGTNGQIKSEFIQELAEPGKNILLAIDSQLQNKFYKILKSLSLERGFNGGAGIVLDVSNGEILSLVSYPEYSSSVLARGEPVELVKSYLNNSQKPFLNRAVSGLYAPGSVVKPFVAIAALNEKTIDPLKQIFSSGSISLPNPYFPDQESVFYDWKAHGWVDMRRALAVSSNVYFYSLGGGFEDVTGLGIERLKKYFQAFGLSKKTGIDLSAEEEGLIPDPIFKEQHYNDPIWRIGDTYNISIGQGGFQITPVQMAVAVAALANNGRVLKPQLLLGEDAEYTIMNGIQISDDNFQVVKEGMRKAVLEGTARGLSGLGIKIAAKTGTAELGSGKFVNSWLVAFWPYENPRYAISIVLEKGDASNLIGGVSAARQFFEWMIIHRPEYLQVE